MIKLKKSKWNQIFAALVANIGAFGMGSVVAWTSPALPDLQERGQFGQLSSDEENWIASFVPLASLISGPPTGFAIAKFGRKWTMLWLCLPFIFGWGLIKYSGLGTDGNLAMLLSGRFLTGFCGGAFSLAAPVYISETAGDEIRGMLGSAFQLLVTMGIFFSYILGKFMSWDTLALVSAIVPIICLILMFMVPESPRYFISKGRDEDATKALTWLRHGSSEDEINNELILIRESLEEAKANRGTFKDLFKSATLKPVSISLGLMLFQQLSGIESVIFFTVDIFKDAGSDIEPNTAAIIVGAVQVVATIAATALVDKIGRRILLMISGLVMSLSLISIGTFFYLKEHKEESADNLGWLPLLSLMIFIIAFSLGFGPIPWMMMGEILPNNIIGKASALAISFNWTLAFLVTRFFGNMNDALGTHVSFWLFGGATIVGILFVFFCVPETTGQSLEKIQEQYIANSTTSENGVHTINPNDNLKLP